MLIRKFTYIITALLLSATLVLPAGCTKDKVDEGQSEYPQLKPDEYALSIDFTLDADDWDGVSTRACTITRANIHPDYNPEEWETFVDLRSEHRDPNGNPYEFYLLMFDENNNFIYNPKQDEEMFYISNMNITGDGGELRRWRAVFHVPLEIREHIQNNKFKIAVFANWPTALVENPYHHTMDAPMPAQFLQKIGDGTVSIRELAHSVYDEKYGGEFSSTYMFLTDTKENQGRGGRMGPSTDWVYNYHPTEEDAVLFTRGLKADRLGYTRHQYDVIDGEDTAPDPRIFRRKFSMEFETDERVFLYPNLWLLWNFGGSANLEANGQGKIVGNGYQLYDGSSDYVKIWAERNDERIKNLLNSGSPAEWGYGETHQLSGNFVFTEDNESVEDGALEFTGPGTVTFGRDTQADGGGAYIQLPVGKANYNSNGTLTSVDNAMHFYSFADAVLVIKTDNIDDIQIASDTYEFDFEANNKKEAGDNTWFIDIPNKKLNINIYTTTGKAKIYEVELLQKKYLYDSDRRTLLPSQHQLIPMYGIQEFDPVGDYWIPGNVFDLSHNNGFHHPGYNYKAIYLLRSVAKVELLVSKEFEQMYTQEGIYRPRIIMRSMNRDARCMPLDVATPTEQIWANVDQEILNIRKHGPYYNPDITTIPPFQNKLAWYFRTWEDLWDWDWNSVTLPDIDRTLDSPHVFNAKINRSDYVRFIKVEPRAGEEEFDRYIFYMPEKAIDDADDAGYMNSTPKVPHIELRLKGESILNLDDDDHSRIYFMDYASTGGPDFSNGFNNYEKSAENLKNHWPVMRNHVYKFRIFPDGIDNIRVSLEVAGAAGRDITDIPAFQ